MDKQYRERLIAQEQYQLQQTNQQLDIDPDNSLLISIQISIIERLRILGQDVPDARAYCLRVIALRQGHTLKYHPFNADRDYPQYAYPCEIRFMGKNADERVAVVGDKFDADHSANIDISWSKSVIAQWRQFVIDNNWVICEDSLFVKIYRPLELPDGDVKNDIDIEMRNMSWWIPNDKDA